MPSLLTSDCPGTAHIIRLRCYRIIFAFTVDPANRVYGGKVDHIKSHFRYVGNPLFCVPEGPMHPLRVRGGTGKKLIPCAEAGFFTIHPYPEDFIIMSGKFTAGIEKHHLREVFPKGIFRPFRKRSGVSQFLFPGMKPVPVLFRRASGTFLHEMDSGLKINFFSDPSIQLLSEITSPALEMVHPGKQGVAITHLLIHSETGTPAVIHQWFHFTFMPVLFIFPAVFHHTGDQIMPVTENVRLDNHFFACDTFNSITSAVDLGSDPFNDNPFSPIKCTACALFMVLVFVFIQFILLSVIIPAYPVHIYTVIRVCFQPL